MALVFGREESGLTAEELVACSHLCSIPTVSTQPSMNLAHAASAVLAQTFELCALGSLGVEGAGDAPLTAPGAYLHCQVMKCVCFAAKTRHEACVGVL